MEFPLWADRYPVQTLGKRQGAVCFNPLRIPQPRKILNHFVCQLKRRFSPCPDNVLDRVSLEYLVESSQCDSKLLFMVRITEGAREIATRESDKYHRYSEAKTLPLD